MAILTQNLIHLLQIVLEEFGKWVKNTTTATKAQRQQFYQLAYSYVLKVSFHDFSKCTWIVNLRWILMLMKDACVVSGIGSETVDGGMA